jgi:cell division protein FtsL
MEVTDVAARIEDCNAELEELIKQVDEFIKKKKFSTTKAFYRKSIEKAVYTLLADKKPTTVVRLLAEGICSKEEADHIDAKIEWDSLNAKIDARKAILNGWQSVNRHLSHV